MFVFANVNNARRLEVIQECFLGGKRRSTTMRMLGRSIILEVCKFHKTKWKRADFGYSPNFKFARSAKFRRLNFLALR